MKSKRNLIYRRLRVIYYLGLSLLVSSSMLLVACSGNTVVPSGPPPPVNPIPSANPNANKMGINIAAPLDFESDHLYADIIKTSREFKMGVNENSTTLAATDSNGWPNADFSFYLWGSLPNRNGTYTLTFNGKATVTSNPSISMPTTYDLASNTSSATFNYTNIGSSTFAMRFASTQKTDASAINTGVTNIKLMRPLVAGSTTSYPPTTLFTTPIKTLISKFSVIRFMDFLATNRNPQKTWADRPNPRWASFNRFGNSLHSNGNPYGWQGIGGSLEHAILLANETGSDAWINIPVLADNAYVTNVANLLAYGSDGLNPYTAVTQNPVYPPLNSNLKVYIEYSNELWNSGGAFIQTYQNCQLASEELTATAGDSPINWDNLWTPGTTYANNVAGPGWNYSMCWRRPIMRTVEISNIFRGVFGDSAMMTRVRPVMMTQLTASGRTLFDGSKMLLDYYNHMTGTFTTTPAQPAARPPSYYIYGAGGSGYYDPQNPGVTTVDEFFADLGMLPAGYSGDWGPTGMRPSLQADARYTAAMGVKRIAYEGGPNLETGVNVSSYAITLAAVNDARMKTAMINMHNEWSANSGDLFVYYRSSGDAQWSFTQDVTNLGTNKFAAIDALNIVDRSPITFGALFPGSLAGTAASVCSRNNTACSMNNRFGQSSSQPWQSYTFRSTAAAPWTVTLTLTDPVNATVAVYVDGVKVDTTKTAAGTVTFNAGNIESGIHGVIVRAVSGTFTLGTIAVD